jgi:hypothetical protein
MFNAECLLKISRICETAQAELQELERKKREVFRALESLKKELTVAKNANDRKAILERMAEIKVCVYVCLNQWSTVNYGFSDYITCICIL